MADTALAALAASAALTGTELFYSDSGAADVKVTATQIRTFSHIVGTAQTFDVNSGTTAADWQYASVAATIAIARFSTSGPPRLVLARSRGGSVGTYTVNNDTDELGDIIWNGSDGSAFQSAARIRVEVNGTPGAGDMPGKMFFCTTRDGLGSTTDQWAIAATGDMYSIGGAGQSIGILAGGGSTATGSRIAVETTAGSSTCSNQFVSTALHPAAFVRWSTVNRAASIFLCRANSATIGTYTLVDPGEDMGEINVAGSDGSVLKSAAYIRIVNDDLTVNSTRADPGALTESDGVPALGSVPGTIWFATTELSSSGPTRRWAINSVGSLFPYSDNEYNFGKTDARPAATYLGPVVDCESIDPGATGPILSLYHNSASPAAADLVGQLEVYGKDSAANKTLYGELRCILQDTTNGSEDATWALSQIIAGSAVDVLVTSATAITTPGSFQIASGTATPAGGTAALGYRMGSTSNLGIFFGSGVPSLSAAQGSLYIRTDGSTTATRLYVNTNGTTGWTNFTSAT